MTGNWHSDSQSDASSYSNHCNYMPSPQLFERFLWHSAGLVCKPGGTLRSTNKASLIVCMLGSPRRQNQCEHKDFCCDAYLHHALVEVTFSAPSRGEAEKISQGFICGVTILVFNLILYWTAWYICPVAKRLASLDKDALVKIMSY